jgi:polysaccharide pyruvyl transferase WcaK-like protein
MRIHHFYPKTPNIGDHFVQRGIERMIRTIVSDATFDLFNVNSRGEDKTDYGLTRTTVDRANREADLVIVGGSNLYQGSYRWRWGVHLEANALENLHVPLFLLGIGAGSDFLSPPHDLSASTRREIKLLNSHATFSGVRDVITYDWLHGLGVTSAELMGDPASFIFNHPVRPPQDGGHILMIVPPLRFWKSKRQFWKVRLRGRVMFHALTALCRTLLEKGNEVTVVCNDPLELELAQTLFDAWLPTPVICPRSTEEYFRVLAASRAVVTGRLHTAVVSFSLGIPFLLTDVDYRTHGFIKTYQLDRWAVTPSRDLIETRLKEKADILLSDEAPMLWEPLIEKRDRMYQRAMNLLAGALESLT